MVHVNLNWFLSRPPRRDHDNRLRGKGCRVLTPSVKLHTLAKPRGQGIQMSHVILEIGACQSGACQGNN